VFNDRRGKRLPHFREYLKKVYSRSDDESSTAAVLGCAVVPLAMVGTGLFAAQFMHWGLAALAGFFVGGPLAGGLLAYLWHRLARPKTAEEKRRRELTQALDAYRQPAEKGRLHKELDPTAAQLLEAAAYYWEQIGVLLNRPPWVGEESKPYSAIREQALAAANEAMLEASALCVPCLGKPAKEKKDRLKEAFEDLADLDIIDALEGFRQVARADSAADAHHSPHIRLVFEPVRQYAEKLKSLNHELEELSAKMMAARPAGATSTLTGGAATTIDLVLSEIRLVRQAESELDDEQHLRGQS
jgi:hypothetical protein